MSERTLDSDFVAAAESGVFIGVVLVHLDFPSGAVRIHNHVGTLSFGGNDYLGVGTFGGIEAMEENADLTETPIKLSLSSITQEIIDAVKDDDLYGRDADIYLGALNEHGELIGTPDNWISGYMEHAEISIGSEDGVTITVQDDTAKFRRRSGRKYTIEEHQVRFPGDLFLEFLPYLLEAEVIWGGEKVRTGFRNTTGFTGSPEQERHPGLGDQPGEDR